MGHRMILEMANPSKGSRLVTVGEGAVYPRRSSAYRLCFKPLIEILTNLK